MTPIEEIAAERRRQVEREGYDTAHDDAHTDGSIADAAASYAQTKPVLEIKVEYEWPTRGEYRVAVEYDVPMTWPSSWHARRWKPKDRRRDLIRAGALIVAEIERLDRAEKQEAA